MNGQNHALPSHPSAPSHAPAASSHNAPDNAPQPAPQNGPESRIRRKRPPTNPLISRPASRTPKPIAFLPKRSAANPIPKEIERPANTAQYGGWSEPPPTEPYTDFPIVTTKRELKEGLRFHIMRLFKAKGNDDAAATNPNATTLVDLMNENEFTRPITLHRRDPRQPPPGRGDVPLPQPSMPYGKAAAATAAGASATDSPSDEKEAERAELEAKEAERQARLQAEREAQRAVDLAKIAPSQKDPKPTAVPKKKEEGSININRQLLTDAGKKESEIRYEESLPWHLEDADGRNVWMGAYERALSEANVALIIDGPKFRMVPLEKWYKFTAKPPFTPYTSEQAEEILKKQPEVGRWMMVRDEKREEERRRLAEWRSSSSMAHGSSGRRRMAGAGAGAGADDSYDAFDMDPGDEFQDDDETAGFQAADDEDTKIANDRIRREQLGANFFANVDENEVDEAETKRRREREMKKKLTKKLKKAFQKQMYDGDLLHSEDSDDDPFQEEATSEDSDSEKEDEDEDKKTDIKDEPSSTPGSVQGTPSKRKKAANETELAKRAKTLKRPGSPIHSESSGNESSRKKLKNHKSHHPPSTANTSVQPSRSGTPLPAGQRKASSSQGDVDHGDSDAKTKRLQVAGRAVSPSSSVPGSPSLSGATSPRPSATAAAVEAWEIIQAVPAEGITVGMLLNNHFRDRVGEEPGKMSRQEWIRIVRNVCDYGADKLLRRKA